jgi:hypothetical protein
MKKIFFSLSIALLFFYFGPIVSSAFAASLQLDPATVSTPAGEIFTVNVNVDAGTAKIKSADAYIIYDPKIVEAQSVADGTFFSVVNKDVSTSGKAYVSGMVDDPTKPVTGTGTIATITFKALAEGTNALEFDCTAGSTNGSMIIADDDKDTNIIECTKNGASTVTVGSGVAVTPTTDPELGPSAYPTPSTLPKSGVFDNVIKFAVPGAILLFIGTAARLLL